VDGLQSRQQLEGEQSAEGNQALNLLFDADHFIADRGKLEYLLLNDNLRPGGASLYEQMVK
jgi:hypothetical protein